MNNFLITNTPVLTPIITDEEEENFENIIY